MSVSKTNEAIPATLDLLHRQNLASPSPSSKFQRVFKSLPNLGRKFQYRRYTIENRSHTLWFSLFLVVARRSSRTQCYKAEGQVGSARFDPHCRYSRRWKNLPLPQPLDHFRGAAKVWASPEPVKRLELADGRTAVFVKDLSELSDDRQSDDVLDLLERSVLGSENDQFIVVAANHGQILERLRVLGQRQGRPHPLRKPIQDAFLLGSSTPERLAIFELSHTARRQSLEEVLSAVAEHPEWENCAKCHLKSEERLCPIFENKERLRGKGDGKRFAKRLGDLVELARNNGWHLPVRDLLALVANMVLGHRDAKEGLLSCSEVANIQDTGKVENGSVYDNVFGANLPRRRASDRQVFQALYAFGIGEETTNEADGLLVYEADDPQLRRRVRAFGEVRSYLWGNGFLSGGAGALSGR